MSPLINKLNWQYYATRWMNTSFCILQQKILFFFVVRYYLYPRPQLSTTKRVRKKPKDFRMNEREKKAEWEALLVKSTSTKCSELFHRVCVILTRHFRNRISIFELFSFYWRFICKCVRKKMQMRRNNDTNPQKHFSTVSSGSWGRLKQLFDKQNLS